MSSSFRDPEFQEQLLVFVCRDRNFMKECGHLLTTNDFKPSRQGESQEIWVVANRALEFYRKYREPIGGMLRSEILDYCRQNNSGEKFKINLLGLVETIKRNKSLIAVEALVQRVVDYKKERLKKKSMQEMIELEAKGQLTDERWLEMAYQALEQFGELGYRETDFFEGLEERIHRREMDRGRRYPMLMIDPLDEIIRLPGRGHLGLWLAYLKMGKSLAFCHSAVAYILQGMNVLLFTLEDPLEEVENRLDAAISSLPTKNLVDLPNKLRIRFARFARLLRSRLKIVDGTEGGFTVNRMEEIWERERNRGFCADVVLIDYDDEITPSKKQKERRFEFADIYRDLRRFAAKREVILWTAAQTGRQSEGKKVITSGMTAEDISKARKATVAIGIGVGDWGPSSRYLYVAAHKFDRMHVGCNIVCDFPRTIFYDRTATLAKMQAEDEKKKEDSDE